LRCRSEVAAPRDGEKFPLIPCGILLKNALPVFSPLSKKSGRGGFTCGVG
jgi:hypothetical protein